MTQGALAALVHCDQSWISSLENGRGIATPELARAIDDVLETGGVLLRSLKYIDREATAAYHPDFFRKYVELEAKALTLREWYPYGFPGLLQVEPYMRAQLAEWHSPTRIAELTAARLSRTERLFGDYPLRVLVVIDESVLHRIIGSRHVMANQLKHLIDMMGMPNVVVRILPNDRPPLAFVDSPMAFLDMPSGQSWFYTEGLDHGRISDDPAVVSGHRARYDLLRASALPVPESQQMIYRSLGELINVTPSYDAADLGIFKSSYSGGGNSCVGSSRDLLALEIAPVVDTALGAASPVLPFTTAAFASFVDAVKRRDPAFAFGERYVTP